MAAGRHRPCSWAPATRWAILVYQIGTLITTGTLGAGFAPGLIAVLAIVMVFALLIRRTNRQLSRDYALNAGD